MTCVSLQHDTHENVRTGSLAGAGLWGDLPGGPARRVCQQPEVAGQPESVRSGELTGSWAAEDRSFTAAAPLGAKAEVQSV